MYFENKLKCLHRYLVIIIVFNNDNEYCKNIESKTDSLLIYIINKTKHNKYRRDIL